MIYPTKDLEKAKLLVLTKGNNPKQFLQNLGIASTTTNSLPPLSLSSSLTALPPSAHGHPFLDVPLPRGGDLLYPSLQSFFAPPQQLILSGQTLGGGIEGWGDPRLFHVGAAARLSQQQQDRELMLAMAMVPPRTSSSMFCPQNLSNVGAAPGISPLKLHSTTGKRSSHSAEAIHRARIAKAASAYVSTPGLPTPLSDVSIPSSAVLQSATSSLQFPAVNASAPKEQHVSVPCNDSNAMLAPTQTDPTKISASPPPNPAPMPQAATLPPPVKRSWMYNIDLIHPSPLIQTTEDDGGAPTLQNIPSDTKTKRFSVREEDITPEDILSGRGGKSLECLSKAQRGHQLHPPSTNRSPFSTSTGKTNHHEGNTGFRRLVSKYKKDYICAKKFVKRQMVCKIVLFVRQRQGRFLQKESDGFWYEIGDTRAHAKLAQAMREGASVASICRELIANGAPPPRQDSVQVTSKNRPTQVACLDVSPNPHMRFTDQGSSSLPPRKRWI